MMIGEPCLDFFYDAGSCSLAVRIVLEECGWAYRAHRVSSRGQDGEAGRPAWLARNPKVRVPALSPIPGHPGGEALLLTEVRPGRGRSSLFYGMRGRFTTEQVLIVDGGALLV